MLVNILTMIGLMAMNQIARNCAPTLKEAGLFNCKCWYIQRVGGQYLMLLCREVNRKVKLPSSNQQATGYVSDNNRCIIPCIQRHNNTFHKNTIVAALIAKKVRQEFRNQQTRSTIIGSWFSPQWGSASPNQNLSQYQQSKYQQRGLT